MRLLPFLTSLCVEQTCGHCIATQNRLMHSLRLESHDALQCERAEREHHEMCTAGGRVVHVYYITLASYVVDILPRFSLTLCTMLTVTVVCICSLRPIWHEIHGRSVGD